eukprot:UN00801
MNEHGHPKPAGDKTSYRISKAALNMCIRCFAAEYPDIIFNSVNPGWVQTDMGSIHNITIFNLQKLHSFPPSPKETKLFTCKMFLTTGCLSSLLHVEKVS